MSRTRICRAISCSALLTALAGCGQPGPPLRPSANLPQPPSDLTAERRGATLRLEWTQPRVTSDGVTLKGAIGAGLCAWPAGAAPPNATLCPAAQRLSPAPVAAATTARHGAKVAGTATVAALLAAGLPAGAAEVCVQLTNPQGQTAGCSNQVEVSLVAVAAAPQGLRAVATPAGIELTWEPPTPQPAFIHVYRQTVPARGAAQPAVQIAAAGGMPVPRQYLDTDTTLGTNYSYFVRSAAQTAESEDSNAATAEAGDFAPPAPGGLRVLPSAEGGVELSWEIVNVPGTAGYNVYRQAPGGDWVKLNQAALPTPLYHDTPPAGAVQYRVTAVGFTGKESPPSADAPGPPKILVSWRGFASLRETTPLRCNRSVQI